MDEFENIKNNQLSKYSFSKLADFYSLFADQTRLSIIALLCENELCVSDIVNILELSQSRVSHQLAILRKKDVVKYYRKGKKILYALTDNHIKDLFKTGLEHISEKDTLVYQDRKKTGR